MKLKIALLMVLALPLMSLAGSEGGGGGDAVILPDGSVVLADVFLDRDQPQPGNMPRRISLNPKLLSHMQTYSDFLENILDNTNYKEYIWIEETSELKNPYDIWNLVSEFNQKNSLIFYSVKNAKELNDHCASGGKKAYRLPSGAEVTQVACTSGDEIFLVESVFKKMDIKHQALLLMHERMTTLRDEFGGRNYAAIAGVTSGLDVILTVAYEQQKGIYRRLSEKEVSKIENFYNGVLELEFRNSEIPKSVNDMRVYPNGGGLIHIDSEVHESTFVSVTSSVSQKIVTEEKVKVLNSVIRGPAILKKNVTVNDSYLEGVVRADEGTKIINSSFITVEVRLGTNVEILNSRFYGYIDIGDDSKIVSFIAKIKTEKKISYSCSSKCIFGKRANLKEIEFYASEARVGNDFTAENSTIDILSLTIKENQSLLNGKITSLSLKYFPRSVKPIFPGKISVVLHTDCLTKDELLRKKDLSSISVNYCRKKGGATSYSLDHFRKIESGADDAGWNNKKEIAQYLRGVDVQVTKEEDIFSHTIRQKNFFSHIQEYRSLKITLDFSRNIMNRNTDELLYALWEGQVGPADYISNAEVMLNSVGKFKYQGLEMNDQFNEVLASKFHIALSQNGLDVEKRPFIYSNDNSNYQVKSDVFKIKFKISQ